MNSLYWYGENWIKGAPQFIELEDKLNNLQQKFDNLKYQYDEMEQKNIRMVDENARLEIKVDEVNTEMEFNKNINDQISRKEINSLRAEINDLNMIISTQNDHFNILTNENKKLNSEQNNLKTELENEIENLKLNLKKENEENIKLKSIVNKLKDQAENILGRNDELEIELLSYKNNNRKNLINSKKINTETQTQTQELNKKSISTEANITESNIITRKDKTTQKFPSFINTNHNDEISSTHSSPNDSDRFNIEPFLSNLDETLKFPCNFSFSSLIDNNDKRNIFNFNEEDDGTSLIKRNKKFNDKYNFNPINELDSELEYSSEESDFEL